MPDVNFDLLDSSVEDLAELEAFTPIPAGTHRLSIGWETKEINSKPSVILKMAVIETLEMANVNEEAPEAGKKADVAFMLLKDDGSDNTMGQGQLRSVIESLRETFEGDTTRETMEASEGAEVVATLKIRVNKNDPEQKFNNIVTLSAE